MVTGAGSLWHEDEGRESDAHRVTLGGEKGTT